MKRDEFRAVAVDLGASGGKAFLGTVRDGKMEMEEVRRFPNGPVRKGGRLCWDFGRLVSNVTEAVEEGLGRGGAAASVGVDSWGVDYVLLGADGEMLGEAVSYRDPRTQGVMERFFREVFREEEVYRVTGIQFMPINTLYQLAAEKWSGEGRLEQASKLLFIPDAVARVLGGGPAVAEYTVASTSQMLDAVKKEWWWDVVDRLGLKRDVFPGIVEPGTKLGSFRSASGVLDVLAAAAHDTASAVAAVPADEAVPWAFVSCGTWSLIGVEGRAPVLSPEAAEAGLTNEGGVAGTFRQLVNVTGLWLLQECLRCWNAGGGALDAAALCREAEAVRKETPLLDPDSEIFFSPSNMPAAIAGFCRDTGQTPPETPAETAKSIFESIALKTALRLETVSSVTGRRPEVLHIVGGGSRNRLLCRMTASACGLTVLAGPAEATAVGNILVQAMAKGVVGSLSEGRELVRRSFPPERFEPEEPDEWRRKRERFLELVRS